MNTPKSHARQRLVEECQQAIQRGDKEEAERLDREINEIDRRPVSQTKTGAKRWRVIRGRKPNRMPHKEEGEESQVEIVGLVGDVPPANDELLVLATLLDQALEAMEANAEHCPDEITRNNLFDVARSIRSQLDTEEKRT